MVLIAYMSIEIWMFYLNGWGGWQWGFGEKDSCEQFWLDIISCLWHVQEKILQALWFYASKKNCFVEENQCCVNLSSELARVFKRYNELWYADVSFMYFIYIRIELAY